MSKPPAWKDEAALVDYVNQAINALLSDPGRSGAEYGVPALPRSVAANWVAKAIETLPVKLNLATFQFVENEAVDAAVKGGNYMPLAWLLDPTHPLNDQRMKPALCTALAPSTYALIADILSGRRKRPKHRPRLSEHERRMINPIHDAVDEVPGVEGMLRAWYPGQTAKQIYDRALYVVATRHEVKLEALDAYLKRPKSDHRRPMHHPSWKIPGVEGMSGAWYAEQMVKQILSRALYLVASSRQKSETLEVSLSARTVTAGGYLVGSQSDPQSLKSRHKGGLSASSARLLRSTSRPNSGGADHVEEGRPWPSVGSQ